MLFYRLRIPLLAFGVAVMQGVEVAGQDAAGQRAEGLKASAADEFLKDAIAAEERRDFAAALGLLAKAIEGNSELAEAYFRRGRIYKMGVAQSRAYIDPARNDLDKALELDPGHAEWWAERANLYEVIGEPLRAIGDYNKAISLRGDQPGWFLQRSIAFAHSGQLNAADQDNRRVIELVTNQAGSPEQMTPEQRQLLAFAWLNNVPVLLAREEYDEAARFGDEAAKAGEGIPNAHRNRAVAYLRRGVARRREDDLAVALSEFDRTLSLMPNYHAARFERGTALLELKRYREAAAEMSTALRMGGPNPQGLMQLVDCCVELGEFAVAAQWLGMARKYDPASWAYPWQLGRVHQAQGDIDAALEHFGDARRIASENPEVLSDLVLAYAVAGHADKAEEARQAFLKSVDALIDETPDRHQLVLAKASLFDRSGELDEAAALFDQAAERMPDDYRPSNALAWILATHPQPDRRDPERALELARRAVELAGDQNPDCLDTLAAALAAGGQYDEAERVQAQAVAAAPNREKHQYRMRLADYRASRPHVRQARPPLPFADVELPDGLVPAQSFTAVTKPGDEIMTARDIARNYRDAVVIIKSREGVGTGMIVDPRGYVLTCAHVLPRYGDCQVTYYHAGDDGREIAREATGEIIGMDVRHDLALLKMAVEGDIPCVRLGLESRVEAGEDVTVIGNPGVGDQILGRTLIEGIISNPVQQIGARSLIQTSAPVSSGCSGGPLFNDRGHVIGVVVSQGGQAIGFAVPMSEVARFLGL